MLSTLLAIAVGLLLGFLAGLGVGGGSLLILWLTLIMNTATDTARAINLMFFIAAAGSVSIFRLRRGALDLKVVMPAVVAGCIAAGLCSWLSKFLDVQILRKFFGILLLLTGFKELFYRPRKAR